MHGFWVIRPGYRSVKGFLQIHFSFVLNPGDLEIKFATLEHDLGGVELLGLDSLDLLDLLEVNEVLLMLLRLHSVDLVGRLLSPFDEGMVEGGGGVWSREGEVGVVLLEGTLGHYL